MADDIGLDPLLPNEAIKYSQRRRDGSATSYFFDMPSFNDDADTPGQPLHTGTDVSCTSSDSLHNVAASLPMPLPVMETACGDGVGIDAVASGSVFGAFDAYTLNLQAAELMRVAWCLTQQLNMLQCSRH